MLEFPPREQDSNSITKAVGYPYNHCATTALVGKFCGRGLVL